MNKRSLKVLLGLHPDLQRLYMAVDKRMPILLTDSTRGRAAQEKAFNTGHSKVHFGESAHNYSPAIACDAYPYPYKDNDYARFESLAEIIKNEAKRLEIPIRQGIDFNMNGNTKDDTFKDYPHTELHPWRDWAAKSKLYTG
jgi:peptidoglycan LD-endopeptidase CwlK